MNEFDKNESIYQPTPWFIKNKVSDNNISDDFKQDSDSVTLSKIPTTEYVIREIITTEESFINMLTFLQDKFLFPLSKILSYELSNIISINIDEILVLHKQLYEKLKEAIDGGQGRSIRICLVFDSFKIKFIQIYTYFFQNLNNSLKCIDSISNSKNPFWDKWEKIRSESKHSNKLIKLNELILCPFQRFTKYPILFERLIQKNETKDNLEKNEIFKSTIKNLREILFFLNQCEKDQIEIQKIEYEIINTLNGGICGLDLKAYGRFLKFIEVIYGKGTLIHFRDENKKYLLLFETYLIICNKSDNKYIYIDSFPIDENLIVIDSQQTNKNEYEILFIYLRLRKYQFYYKTDQLEQMKCWSEEIKKLADLSKDKNKSHKFLLTNFSSNLTICSSCNKYLEGIFFQGFKCTYCFKVYHRECLKNTIECELKLKPESVIFRKKETLKNLPGNISSKTDNKSAIAQSTNSSSSRDEKMISNSSIVDESLPEMAKTVITCVNEIENFSDTLVYKAIDKHENLIYNQSCLNFDLNDYIFVTEIVNDQTSRGFKLRFKSYAKEYLNIFKEEGVFLKTHITNFDKSSDLNFYSWYLECERKTAEQILKQIKIENSSIRHIFMVRYNQIKYTITMKFNTGIIKHINIDKELINGINCYTMVIDNQKRYFTSISNLINFFRMNSLKDCTNDLIDTLDSPYREALPLPIYTVKAKVNFEGVYSFILKRT